MPQENNQKLSEVIFSWRVPEYFRYNRGIWWYIISILVLAGVITWSIIDKNYLLAVIGLLFYLVVVIYNLREPELIDFIITPDGLKFGRNFYSYEVFENFFIIYEDQGIKNIYFDFKNPFRGRLVIPLDDQEIIAIREFLLQFLEEDLERKSEPLSQQLGRWLKF